MAVSREQIEHLEHVWMESGNMDNPWRKLSHSRKWLKTQMNRYMRRQNKHIEDDDIGFKQGRKPLYGYEY